MVFNSKASCKLAFQALLDLESHLDPLLYPIIESRPQYATKAQLVTNVWRDFSFLGRAVGLWSLLALSEQPADDQLRADWLIKAVNAALSDPSNLTVYLDNLHLIVSYFEAVRGPFPQSFLNQLLSTLILHSLETQGSAAMLALVQDHRRKKGARTVVDTFLGNNSGRPRIFFLSLPSLPPLGTKLVRQLNDRLQVYNTVTVTIS